METIVEHCPASPVPNPMLPAPWRIESVRKELADTFTLTLTPADGGLGMLFATGQFNMLYVFGIGEVPISISGNPSETGNLVHTTRAVGVVTRAMGKLKMGDMIGIRGPYGTAWPLAASTGRDIVIVAGGIGLAPLRGAVGQLLERRNEFGRVAILYGARTPEDILYGRELKKWSSRLDVEVHVTVDHATGRWRGCVGVVTQLIGRASFDSKEATAFVCGPEIMMRYTAQELQGRGVKPDQIHVSMERNMKCATGFCGHCQFGPEFVCKDGPVFRYDRVKPLLNIREL